MSLPTTTTTLDRRRRTRKEIFSFAVEAETLNALYDIAEERGMNLSQIGRHAIKEWLLKRGYINDDTPNQSNQKGRPPVFSGSRSAPPQSDGGSESEFIASERVDEATIRELEELESFERAGNVK